jgi:hypothetical protein
MILENVQAVCWFVIEQDPAAPAPFRARVPTIHSRV